MIFGINKNEAIFMLIGTAIWGFGLGVWML